MHPAVWYQERDQVPHGVELCAEVPAAATHLFPALVVSDTHNTEVLGITGQGPYGFF